MLCLVALMVRQKPAWLRQPEEIDKMAKKTTVTVRQTGSPIRRPAKQRQTLVGLGLNKIGRTRTLEDTPAVRGMIAKVAHMVEIVEESA